MEVEELTWLLFYYFNILAAEKNIILFTINIIKQ